MRNKRSPNRHNDDVQLFLPGMGGETVTPSVVKKPTVSGGSRGFRRVTRDPDVARSYSDNLALGYAIAQGLARALGHLSRSDLADLRAKVSQERSQAKLAGGQ